ncbi:Uncharacterised protein [Acinetobacter baumannii]|nr:Uncharacterised protein [Acinetobacter baumannii]
MPFSSTAWAAIFRSPWLEAWARLSLPLASMRMSPPLAAMSPASFTPTPCSVPTRRIAPAYIPPRAELSIASCGFSLPSAARGVACRLSAWTSLRPVTMLRFFA